MTSEARRIRRHYYASTLLIHLALFFEGSTLIWLSLSQIASIWGFFGCVLGAMCAAMGLGRLCKMGWRQVIKSFRRSQRY